MEVNKHLLESKKQPDLPPMVVVKQELEPLDGTSDVDELNFGELIQDSPPEAFRSPNDEQTRDSKEGDEEDESDDIKCPVCQKDVANLEGLQEHLREHCSDEVGDVRLDLLICLLINLYFSLLNVPFATGFLTEPPRSTRTFCLFT